MLLKKRAKMMRFTHQRSAIKLSSLVLLVVCQGVVSGCSSLENYGRMIGGHLDIMSSREPFEHVLKKQSTSDDVKRKLHLTLEAKHFAITSLHLPDNGSYSTYVDLGRPYVTWNVVATPTYSLQPKQWCFAVIGCLSYRGYYKESRAREYADTLRKQGLDVTVTSATAYSTLGFFKDPVLNTMLRYDDTRYVGILFHELAHQQLYIKADSTFNESYASFVEEEGLRRWLASRDAEDQLKQWQTVKARQSMFNDLLLNARQLLDELYQSDLSDTEKNESKQAIFSQLKSEYESLKRIKWSGYSGYDRWFDRSLNNAHLASVSTYQRLVPVFRQMLRAFNGDLLAFYQEAKAISSLPKVQREARLEAYRNAIKESF